MPIIQVLLFLIVIGFLTWAALRWIPMNDAMKKFIPIAIIVLVIIWLLFLVDLLPFGAGPTVPKFR